MMNYMATSLCSFRKSLPTPFGSILKINNKIILTKLENITCERLNKSEFTEFFKHLFVFSLITALRHKNKKTGCASICNGGGGSTSMLITLC